MKRNIKFQYCATFLLSRLHFRSVNLEYNTLVRWADGTNGSLAKRFTVWDRVPKEDAANFESDTFL